MNKPPSLPGKTSSKKRRLTGFLEELGGETIVTDDGDSVTRDEALAKTLWSLALGGTYKDEDGDEHFRHPDKAVAIFIVERREGRMPMTSQLDTQSGMTASDRIDELARSRINSETDALCSGTDTLDSVSENKSSVDVPNNGDQGS